MAETVIDYPRGVTFEEVWAALKENAERQKETDRQLKESRENFDRQLKEDREKFDREMKESRKEHDRRLQELDRRMGDLHNRFGEIAEHLVAPGIVSRFNEKGHHFSDIAPNGYRIHDENGKIKTEIDMLLENGKSIMVVEVKTRPRVQDVEHHVKRIEIIREHRNKRGDKRAIFGAIAGAVFGKQEKEATIEAGLYVIEQSGDTMQIRVPEGFVPREW